MAHRDVVRRAAVLAVLVVTAAGIVWLAVGRNEFFDLKVYSGAVRYGIRDGGMIYDWLRPGTPYGFTYPPFAALVMAPMAYLPFGLVLVLAGAATVISTAVLLWWLIAPAVHRAGWSPWFALSAALCLAVAFEPVRETFSFGQVNTLLLLLVAVDLLHGLPRGSRWAGAGIGLAMAVKLTPGVFIVYLLVTGRWRAAGTAIGTAAAVTLGAAAIAPDMSREFWTAALWDTDRVGDLAYVSNQSLRGLVARLPLTGHGGTVLWLALVLAAVGWWGWRVRRAAAAGDEVAALALTGILGCLISPVTWVHHLVWVLPALVLVLEVGLSAARGSRRRRLFWVGVAAYLLMSSRLLWVWENKPDRVLEIVGANLDVWFCLVLLVLIPVRSRPAVADHGKVRDGAVRPGQPDRGPLAVSGQA
jgi:alpha-1,2-mannosyltransferase